eukprot:m.171252 g.171252  ORF g.171252 m.171252 type:complete len:467 (+) comp13350_c0_seq1:54-1454(+)
MGRGGDLRADHDETRAAEVKPWGGLLDDEIEIKPMKIHGKWYDLSNFKHPGGPVMLKLGESRDATAMFEAHHPFTSRKYLETIMDKHRIDDKRGDCFLLDPMDEHAVFEWPGSDDADKAPVSDFARELRESVVELYLKPEAKRRGVSLLDAAKTTPLRRLTLLALFVTFLVTIPGFFRGEWWTVLATPLANWLFIVNVFHDGSHFALSRDWRVNHLGTYCAWYFSSPLVWYHQHVIGHHAYPNVPLRDPDLYHNGTFERHTKTLKHRKLHRHQAYTWFPIWLIGTFALNFLKPIQLFVTKRYNRSVALIALTDARFIKHVIGRILTFAGLHVWQFFVFDTWTKAIAFSIVPTLLISLCFMVSSQVNHLTNDNVDVSSTDYYKHQVVTAQSFMEPGPLGWATFIFTGGLNLQIEHHLFPCINHIHLPYIRPIVKAVCKKHGVPYTESSGIVEALGKYIDHLETLSVA